MAMHDAQESAIETLLVELERRANQVRSSGVFTQYRVCYHVLIVAG